MSVQPATRDHVPALDGIRGIAILSVLVFHAGKFAPSSRIERLMQMPLNLGWAGVDLFFVLSGFLITGILLRAKGSPTYYRAFYVRRTLRIIPLYAVYCVGVFAVLALRGEAVAASIPWYATYTLNFKIAAVNGWGPGIGGTAAFWSLCVEEQFYLLWPFIVARLTRPRLASVCRVLIGVALLCRTVAVATGHLFAAYVLLPCRVDALLVGAWLAIAATDDRQLERVRSWAPWAFGLAAAGLVGIALATGYTGWDQPLMATVGMTFTALASGALLVLALSPRAPFGFVHRGACVGWLRACGRYAYGLYVLASLGASVALSIGLCGIVPERLGGSALPAVAWCILLTLGVTFAFAWASRLLIEDPANRCKRFFPYESGPRVGPPAPVRAERIAEPV